MVIPMGLEIAAINATDAKSSREHRRHTMSIAAYIKEIGRGKEGARSLSSDQAHDLMSQVLDGRAGGDRRGSPRYSYSAGSAGLVDGTGYPTSSWGVVVGVREMWRDVPEYMMIL